MGTHHSLGRRGDARASQAVVRCDGTCTSDPLFPLRPCRCRGAVTSSASPPCWATYVPCDAVAVSCRSGLPYVAHGRAHELLQQQHAHWHWLDELHMRTPHNLRLHSTFSVLTSSSCISPALVLQAVDELERQIADLTARLAATTAEKLQYKAERDALAEVVGNQHAELQLYRQQRQSQPHPNAVGPHLCNSTRVSVFCQQIPCKSVHVQHL